MIQLASMMVLAFPERPMGLDRVITMCKMNTALNGGYPTPKLSNALPDVSQLCRGPETREISFMG